MTLPKPRPPLNPGETRAYPVLPLRDIVVFPHMIVPLFVGREKSIKALEEVMRSDTFILPKWLSGVRPTGNQSPTTLWILTIVALVAAIKFTAWYPDRVKASAAG